MADINNRVNQVETEIALHQQSIDLLIKNQDSMARNIQILTEQNASIDTLKHMVTSLEKNQIALNEKVSDLLLWQAKTNGVKDGANWLIRSSPALFKVLTVVITGLLFLMAFKPLLKTIGAS